jgi:hypothetical protein
MAASTHLNALVARDSAKAALDKGQAAESDASVREIELNSW